jgi:hypothetical protein
LSTWPETVIPMCAISPAAWIAVVTNSGPLGGPAGLRGGSGGGAGVAGRAARRWAFSAFSAVAARDAAVERVAFGLGFAVVVGFAGAAFADGVPDVLALPRRPSRSGRVEGRLASTPSCAAADFLGFLGLAGLSVIENRSNARTGTQYSHHTRFVESGKYRA